MRHNEWVKLRGQLAGASSLLYLWVSMTELRSSGLRIKGFYLLCHLTGL